MNKKSLILVSVLLFVLFTFSGIVFATNDVKDTTSNITNTVIDGVNELGSDVRNGIGNAENGIEDALRMNTTDENNTNNSNGNNSNNNKGNTSSTQANAVSSNSVETPNKLPYTGKKYVIILSVVSLIILAIVMYKKYKDCY